MKLIPGVACGVYHCLTVDAYNAACATARAASWLLRGLDADFDDLEASSATRISRLARQA